MNNLTTNELKILNNLSRVLDPDVKLGDKVQELINVTSIVKTGTPVNAVASTATLGITGVSIDSETLTIGNHVYEFLADVAQTKTNPTNIPINIFDKTERAYATLALAAQPTSGDTITIGTKTYIFVPDGTANADGEISIGTDLASARLAFVAAVNGTDGFNNAHPLVEASNFEEGMSFIVALVGGTAGNSIALSETFTSELNIVSAATLGSGTNCTAVNTAAVVIAAINDNENSLVTASAGAGNNVVLTSKIAGIIGDDIDVSDTMANATFGAGVTSLSGGVNGTVTNGISVLLDASYLYVCRTSNTIHDANWRRVSLGSVY